MRGTATSRLPRARRRRSTAGEPPGGQTRNHVRYSCALSSMARLSRDNQTALDGREYSDVAGDNTAAKTTAAIPYLGLEAERDLRHQLGGRIDQQPNDAANQCAVDTDVLQILAHRQLDLAHQGAVIPALDHAGDEVADLDPMGHHGALDRPLYPTVQGRPQGRIGLQPLTDGCQTGRQVGFERTVVTGALQSRLDFAPQQVQPGRGRLVVEYLGLDALGDGDRLGIVG